MILEECASCCKHTELPFYHEVVQEVSVIQWREIHYPILCATLVPCRGAVFILKN